MESIERLRENIGGIDIYLLDQVLKNRYGPQDMILDAGCGSGRNLHWFVQNNFSISGIDRNPKCIADLIKRYRSSPAEFKVANLTALPYPDAHFDHIISSAVLHFSESEDHFWTLWSEHWRVLKAGGSFFIRMTSEIGIEQNVREVGIGVYQIPDGSIRFLLTREILAKLSRDFQFEWLAPLKTTNVEDIRCMSTLVLRRL